MTRKTLTYILLVISVFTGNKISAQNEDFNLWTTFSIEKEIVKNLDFQIDLENRLKNNLEMRDETLVEAGLNYSLKSFSFAFVYRFTNVNKGYNEYRYGNRFSYQLGFDQDIKRYNLDLRLKYQDHFESMYHSENGLIPESYLRSRVKLSYNIKGLPLDPFISYESFLRMNTDRPRLIEKERISFGAGYKLNKNNSVGVYMHIQNEMNVKNPDKTYILGLKYKLEI